MLKYLVIAIVFSISAQTMAAVDCKGLPDIVKMGEYGAQEAYSIVRINNLDFRLGQAEDDFTKARLSLATTALVADKEILLKFYNSSTCQEASSQRKTPNSVQLIK